MKVLKFGGTSVGSIESLKRVKSIINECDENIIVVVSALGGITDTLINTANKAQNGSDCTEDILSVKERHFNIIETLVPEVSRVETATEVNSMLEELSALYEKVASNKRLSQETLNCIVSYGERMSSRIVASILDNAMLKDSRVFIKTNHRSDSHVLNEKMTCDNIRVEFAANVDEKVIIVPGFIASDDDTNEVTNLGRGGSDYTAAILAANLDAEVLEIWTDVDGFMTADPRVISSAHVIDKMSYDNAIELCDFGAKVIYLPTIAPVYKKGIPILIKNTFNPSCQGTLISNDYSPSESGTVKGISSISDMRLVSVVTTNLIDINAVLKKNEIKAFVVSNQLSENTIAIAVKNNDVSRLVRVLKSEPNNQCNITINSDENIALIAVVGDNIRATEGVESQLYDILDKNNLAVKAWLCNGSKSNIAFAVDEGILKDAINVLHNSFC